MTTTTITNISYTGTTQTATVTSTYGVPVTAHIWGAGGGSSSLYPGAGGGYSRVDFVAKPGDNLLVAVGQGGGAGGVTAPPPAPPVTFNTRASGYTGTVLYPYSTTGSNGSALISAYGVWNNPNGGGGTIDTTWASIVFPVSGYYTIQGSSAGCGFTTEPQGGGTLYIDGAPVISLPGNFGGGTQSVNVYVTAGTHSVRVYVGQANNGRGQRSSVAFVINQTNPSRIPNAPAGLPGASYIALLFNSRFPPPNQAASVYALGNGDSFLDQWGVWGPDQNDPAFTREYTITVPATANVIFQMSCNGAAEVRLDGNLVLSRTATENPNTTSQAIINVTAGSHTLNISATGSVGVLNRVGVTLGAGDQTSYSGGRGGISDPVSTQGFGGGGGGATVLSLNGVVIGVGAGGGGGAGIAPSNINYITTKYTGSLLTNPFPDLGYGDTGVPGGTIAAGTSGYYAYGRGYFSGDTGSFVDSFNPTSWCVVVNGTIVYGPAATPPPVNTAQQGQYQGTSYYKLDGNLSLEYTAVQCYNFDYTSLNTSAITDAKFNGQNGQDVFNFNTTDTGGGGGGGGGARGGNGGLGRGSGGGGISGHNGLSLGTAAVIPSTGRLPYTNEYYPGGNIAGFNFDTATATPTNGSRLPYRNPYTGWQPWMYQHAALFSANPIEYSVNFPVSGTYTFNMGADYAMTVSVDGTAVASLTGYAGSYATPSPVQVPVIVTAGTHTISIAWNDDGGTAGFALTIAIPGSVGLAQGGQAGVATNGGNGFVVLELTTGGGGSIKDGGEWKPIQTVYVKDSGIWKEVQTTFINNGGTWTPIQGGIVPTFTPINSAFGALVRPYSAGTLLAPPPPAPDYSEPGGTAWAQHGNWD
jgi:hypothetical protein